jgi:Na+/proline symporter
MITLGVACFLFLFACWQYQHRELTAIQRVAQLTVLLTGPTACFFMLGVFSRRANTPGAIFGGIISIMFSLAFNGFPGLFQPVIKGLNWMWIGGLSTAVGFGAGYLMSLFFLPTPPHKLEGLTLRI